jgi:hypothetical protein
MYAKLILNATYCSREEALSRAEDLVRRRFD